MPIDTNYEVKITGTFQGDLWQNVLHYQMIAGTSGGRTVDVGRCVDAAISSIGSALNLVQCPGVEILTVRVQEVGIANPIIQKKAVNSAGSASGDPFPASDAILFTKRCNTGGRQNVGKFYLVGAPDDKAQGGIVDVADGDLITFAQALKQNIVNSSTTFAPIIWHRGPKTAEFVTIVNTRAQMSRQNRRTLPVP